MDKRADDLQGQVPDVIAAAKPISKLTRNEITERLIGASYPVPQDIFQVVGGNVLTDGKGNPLTGTSLGDVSRSVSRTFVDRRLDYVPKYSQRDIDSNAARIAMEISPRSKGAVVRSNLGLGLFNPEGAQSSLVKRADYRPGPAPDFSNYERLKASGTQTALELLAGKKPNGYYVLTDQHRAAFTRSGFSQVGDVLEAMTGSGRRVTGRKIQRTPTHNRRMMTSRAIRGLVYEVGLKKTAEGKHHVTIIPMGVDAETAAAVTYSAELDDRKINRLLGAFGALNPDLKISGRLGKKLSPEDEAHALGKIQVGAMSADRAVRDLREIYSNPRVLRGIVNGDVIAAGRLAKSEDMDVGGYPHRALNRMIGNRARRQRETALASIRRGGKHHRMMTNVLENFDTAVAGAWEKGAWDLGSWERNEATRARYERSAWETLVRPVVESLFTQFRSAVPLGRPGVGRTAIGRPEGGLDGSIGRAFAKRASELQLSKSAKGIASMAQLDEYSYDGATKWIRAPFANMLFQLSRENASPMDKKYGEEFTRIKHMLRSLDLVEEGQVVAENMITFGESKPIRILQNRALSFQRYAFRLHTVVEYANIERKKAGLAPLQVTFKWQTPKAGTRDLGMGVWAGISEVGKKGRRGKLSIRPGDTDAATSFFSIPNMHGEMTNSAGRVYHHRGVYALSEHARVGSHIAMWDRNAMIVSQGLSAMVTQDEQWGVFGKRIGEGLNKQYLLSATEVQAGAFDARHFELIAALSKKNWAGDTNDALTRAWSMGFLEQTNMAEPAPRYDTDLAWMTKHSAVTNYVPPTNPALMDVGEISVPKFMDFLAMSEKELRAEYGKRRAMTDPMLDEESLEGKRTGKRIDLVKIAQGYQRQINNEINQLQGQQDISREQALRKMISSDTLFRKEAERNINLRYGHELGLGSGIGPQKDDRLVSPLVFRAGYFGGVSPVRPQQWGDTLKLPKGTASERALTPWTIVGQGMERFDPERDRMLEAGTVTGAWAIDENGNKIGEMLSSAEAQERMGLADQGIQVSRSGEADLGISMHGEKAMADQIKGMAQSADVIGASWTGNLQMLLGVEDPKALSKHEGYPTVVRGWLNLILAEGKPETRTDVYKKIKALLGDAVTIEGLETEPRGPVMQRVFKDKSFSEYAPLLKLPTPAELADLADMAGVQLYGTSVHVNAAGQRTLFGFRRMLLQTRVAANSSNPATDLRPDQRISAFAGKERPVDPNFIGPSHPRDRIGFNARIGKGFNETGMGIADLVRIGLSGMQAEAGLLHAGGLAARQINDTYRQTAELGTAYMESFMKGSDHYVPEFLEQTYSVGSRAPKRTQEEEALDRIFPWGREGEISRVSPEELLAQGRGTNRPFGMISGEEYQKVYNTEGPLWLRIGGKDLLIPPAIANTEGGSYSLSKIDRAVDSMLRAHQDLMALPDDSKKRVELQDRLETKINAYGTELRKQLTGKGGLLAAAGKRVEISGIGVGQTQVAPNQWGDYSETNTRGMKPFEVRIGLDRARAMGLIAPETEEERARSRFPTLEGDKELAKIRAAIAATANDNPHGFMSVQALAIRQPQVTTGRFRATLVIDPSLKGMYTYLHRSLRGTQLADFDGDPETLITQGMIGNVKPDYNKFRMIQDAAAEAQRIIESTYKPISVPSGGYIAESNATAAKEVDDIRFKDRAEEARLPANVDERIKITQGRIRGDLLGTIRAKTDPLAMFFMDQEKLHQALGREYRDRGLEAQSEASFLRATRMNQLNESLGWFAEELMKVKGKKSYDVAGLLHGLEGTMRDTVRDLNDPDGRNRVSGQDPNLSKHTLGEIWAAGAGDAEASRKSFKELMLEQVVNPFLDSNEEDKIRKGLLFRQLLDWQMQQQKVPAGTSLKEHYDVRKIMQEYRGVVAGGMSDKATPAKLEAALGTYGRIVAGFEVKEEAGAVAFGLRQTEFELSGAMGVIGTPPRVPEQVALAAPTEFALPAPPKQLALSPGRAPMAEIGSQEWEDTWGNRWRPHFLNQIVQAIESMGKPKRKRRVSAAQALEGTQEFAEATKATETLLEQAADAATEVVGTPMTPPEAPSISTGPSVAPSRAPSMAPAEHAFTTSKGGSSKWGDLAALAGGLSLAMLATRSGSPMADMPQPSPKPQQRVHVLDDSVGGSKTGYTINVRATDTRDRSDQEYSRMVGETGHGGLTAFHMADKRRRDNDNQNFSDALKGR